MDCSGGGTGAGLELLDSAEVDTARRAEGGAATEPAVRDSRGRVQAHRETYERRSVDCVAGDGAECGVSHGDCGSDNYFSLG